MERRRIELRRPGGRLLLAEDTGPEAGPLLIFHSGTPGGRSLPDWWLLEAHRRGLRHVSYSRPGYAGSERMPGRMVADCAADAAAVADLLGADSFYNVGNSGGGPHALACAALRPDRVRATLVLGGIAPTRAAGLDWADGMCRENIEELRALRAGEDSLREFIEREAREMLSAEDKASSLGDALSEADLAVCVGRMTGFQDAAIREALADGIWGWYDDQRALWDADWGFSLDRVGRRVVLFQGGEDRMVPGAHGKWLAAHLPGAEFHFFPDEGHISLIEHRYGDALDAMLASARRA